MEPLYTTDLKCSHEEFLAFNRAYNQTTDTLRFRLIPALVSGSVFGFVMALLIKRHGCGFEEQLVIGVAAGLLYFAETLYRGKRRWLVRLGELALAIPASVWVIHRREGDLSFAIFMGMVILFLFLVMFLLPDRNGKKASEQLDAKYEALWNKTPNLHDLCYHYSFFEDHYLCESDLGTVKIPYARLKEIIETERYLFLRRKGRNAIPLIKADCDPGLIALLKEKSGKWRVVSDRETGE